MANPTRAGGVSLQKVQADPLKKIFYARRNAKKQMKFIDETLN